MEENKDIDIKLGHQESLQPQRISKDHKAYQSVRDIEERLRLEDATNIALTGPYGSGKSSILISLKSDYPQYKYLNISLATLQPLQSKTDKGPNNDDIEKEGEGITKENLDRLIEYSILQQLVYREKQETLPDSRLKRIFHLSKAKVKRITWATLGALAALIILFEPSFLRVEWMCELLGNDWLNYIGDTVSLLYLIVFGYLGVQMIVPALGNSKLNKLNLKDGEIEIVKNTSIFNKHLDEILYFFEKTEYNVVILEDLDRFESTEIFLKLRELNLLLNESNVIERKIFFVYAVRDDMFHDADRVKCFDYITTVIPVINRSNAKDQLKEELKKRGVTDIKDYYLQELGFFLHDMRLLKNIANEYIQYHDKLSSGISSEKLLAMIVYKNYFPKDFAELHDCKGIVYQLINLKEDFVADRVVELETQNLNKHEQIEKHQKEKHLKETELRRIYVDAYRDKIGNNIQLLKVGGRAYNLSDIAAKEELFNQLIASPNVDYSYIDTSSGYYRGQIQQASAKLSFSEIERIVDATISYADRLKALRTSFEVSLDNDIIEIKKEDIRARSLSQIMNEVDYHSNPLYAELKVPRLIEFLVVKGYIDENYYDYISYFYGNFINAHDWVYVLDIKLGKSHPYDFPINNVEACLLEIPAYAYRKSSILNIGFVDYLAAHQEEKKNVNRLLVVLRTVIENKKYDFLISYYQQSKQKDIVFSMLFTHHKDLWFDIEKYDVSESNHLRLIWYKYAEKEHGCDESRKWLSVHFDFITDHLVDIGVEQWSQLIRERNYEFEDLNDISSDLLNVIADTDSYTLTRHNIETLVTSLLDMKVDSVSYKLVTETEHEQLINRVEENLDECLNTVFAEPESEKESEDAIVGILLSPMATEDEKIAYLKKQHNKIDLEAIEQPVDKTLALRCDVVKPLWTNVIHYMNNVSDKVLDKELTNFIEHRANELSRLKTPQNSDDDERMLLRQLIKTDSLSYETFNKILNQFVRWSFTGVPIIEERRVMLLINKNMIHYKEENTKDLLENFSAETVVAYLMKNKRDFLTHPNSVTYDTNLALAIMISGFTVREKALIIPHFTKDILNTDLSDNIIIVLVEQEIKLDIEFLLQVMALSNNTEDKITVLNYTLDNNDFDEATITSLIKTLPGKYKEMAEKGKKPEIPYTVKTMKLVRILKKYDYISSYTESKRGIRVNTKLK